MDDAAVHDLHEVDVAGRRVAHHAVHLHVVDAGVDHAALGLEFFQRHLLTLVRLGLFEGEGGGGVLHRLVIGPDEVLEVAAQDGADGVDALVVILLALLADARGLAVAHVVFEARPEFACVDVLLAQVVFAGPNGVQLAHDVEHGVHRLGRSIRSEILRAILDDVPGRMDARETLLADDDGWVGLVVLELDVVSRLVLLDEAVLEEQRVHLGGHHDEPDVGNLLDEQPGLAVLVGLLAEVAGHPLFEAFGLADIEQGPLRIIVLVHPRAVWKALEDALDVRRGFHWAVLEGESYLRRR